MGLYLLRRSRRWRGVSRQLLQHQLKLCSVRLARADARTETEIVTDLQHCSVLPQHLTEDLGDSAAPAIFDHSAGKQRT